MNIDGKTAVVTGAGRGIGRAAAHSLARRGARPAGVVTNIVEQMRFFGDATAPRGPALPIVEADVVGELVADSIANDRFLALTAPEVRAELIERATDIDGYVASRSETR